MSELFKIFSFDLQRFVGADPDAKTVPMNYIGKANVALADNAVNGAVYFVSSTSAETSIAPPLTIAGGTSSDRTAYFSNMTAKTNSNDKTYYVVLESELTKITGIASSCTLTEKSTSVYTFTAGSANEVAISSGNVSEITVDSSSGNVTLPATVPATLTKITAEGTATVTTAGTVTK